METLFKTADKHQKEVDQLKHRVTCLEQNQRHQKVNPYCLLSWRTAENFWCRDTPYAWELAGIDSNEAIQFEIQSHVSHGIREDKRKNLVSCYTPQGLIAVMANQLLITAETLMKARNELRSRNDGQSIYAQPSVFLVNGLLVSAVVGLQSIQDAIASFCQKQEPDYEVHGVFYFSNYPFRVTKFEFINLYRRRIYEHKFSGKTMNDLANCCKHDVPWLGLVQTNDDNINDIADESGTQLLREVLIPSYDETAKLLARIGSMFNQSVLFPSI